MREYFLLLLSFINLSYSSNPHEASLKFCESYVECAAVALLEERLCLGNSRLRPYWLPDNHDPKGCHDKLLNDYKTLDKMEEDMDNQLTACLIENSVPITDQEMDTCTSEVLRDAPRFSFSRTISYVPTVCFTGLERRRERECGAVKKCCAAIQKCESMTTESSLAKATEQIRIAMRKRAKDCEKGLTVPKLPFDDSLMMSTDEEKTWAPTGHVNVNIKDLKLLEQEKLQREQADGSRPGPSGFVNVRVTTLEDGVEVHDGIKRPETAEERARRLLLRAGDGHAGEVSRPVGGDHSRVRFTKLGDKEDTDSSFTVEDGSLVLGIPNIPKDLDSHDKAYDHALENTKEYKDLIERLRKENRGKDIQEGIDSLVAVGKISSNRQLESAASGAVHHLSEADESEEVGQIRGKTVTASPVIFIPKNGKEPVRCREDLVNSARFEKILTMLGEKPDSEDIKEIKSLIREWQTNFRKKVQTAKEKSKNKEIEKALEELISHFDDVNQQILKSFEKNATESISNDEGFTNCVVIEHSEDEPADKVDEHGDKIVVEDGVSKIVLSGSSLVVEQNIDSWTDIEKVEATTPWSNEEYKKELAEYKKKHHINSTQTSGRNETTCDLYMRCRNQMHLAVDGCAWRFASVSLMPTLAESAESLLYKSEEICDTEDQPLYEELYEMVIQRNAKLRTCLDERNKVFFSSSVCLPYDSSSQLIYDEALLRLLSEDDHNSSQCFRDANLIQEKCTKLRECCPNFDRCREDNMDISVEQAILSKTAQINEKKQNCLKTRARDAFKETLRALLGKGGRAALQRIRDGEMGLDIIKGAQILRRM